MSGASSPLPAGYPTEWEADVLLTDGGTARLRPIRPDDAQRLVDFYSRVSPESKYLRFFSPYPNLSARDVRRFTQVDYASRVALIVTLGDSMIGVGRYDRIDDDSTRSVRAEVAFLIEDAHQGRGIGQLLLEHLAQAARERGIDRFVAEVLPQNRRMAQVFADAGYRVSKAIEDGVLEVEFPITPTNTSVGVMERREHRAESTSVRRLLNPMRVAVYGPSERISGVIRAIRTGGFAGEVIAVRPSREPFAQAGSREFRGRVDLALASVDGADLADIVIDAAHRGARGVVLLTGTDFDRRDNVALVNLARAYGVRALGPDALGVINTAEPVRLNATPGPMPRRGGAGLFCQSAAAGVTTLSRVVREGLGVSSFVSTGDYADVSANDVMQYWEDDDATRVCLLSLDSIGNPRKFSRIARRLTRRKPVVVFAPGAGDRAARAGERGAPVGDVMDALFRQAGVMVVRRRGAMINIAAVAARQPLPSGPRARIISNSAPLARQLQRLAAASGLLPDPEPALLGAQASPAEYLESTRSALIDPGYDAVLCAAVEVGERGTTALAEALSGSAARARKPVIGVFVDFLPRVEPPFHADDLGGLPIFGSPADAVRTLAALSAYAHWRARDPGPVPRLGLDLDRARRVVGAALADDPGGRELTASEATEVLAAVGVELVPHFPVASLGDAIATAEGLGWGVVLKATAVGVRGRPDLAGVYRNIDDAAEMTEAWKDLGGLVTDLGLQADVASAAAPVVQAMAPAGVSLVVASHEDPAFGPVLSLGLDGIPSQLLGDTVYRVPPLTTADAAAMVRDLRAAPLLFGQYGSPRADIAAVEDLLHRVAQLADAMPQLARMTLSPCVVSAHALRVLGAKLVVAPTGDRRDASARVL